MKNTIAILILVLLSIPVSAANEIWDIHDTSGDPNYYVMLGNSSDTLIWDVCNTKWNDYNDVNDPNHAIHLELIPPNRYMANVPSAITDTCSITFVEYMMEGSEPNTRNDLLVSAGEIAWSGTEEVILHEEVNAIPAYVWNKVLSSGTFNVANSGGRRLRELNDSLFVGSATARAGGTSTQLLFPLAATAVTDFYKGSIAKIYSGTGVGQSRAITAYDGGTKIATIGPAWATVPDGTSLFTVSAAGSAVVASIDTIALTSIREVVDPNIDKILRWVDPNEWLTGDEMADTVVEFMDANSILPDANTNISIIKKRVGTK